MEENKQMDLINKEVTHKSFGKGNVVEHTDSHIEINFKLGNKKFIYPDAFGKYLTILDQKTADSVDVIIQKREIERKQERLEIKKRKALERKEEERIFQREKILKNLRIHPSSQAAFWCELEDKDRLFEEWRVSTGQIKSGVNKGKPNRLIRLNQNSACLITARSPEQSENERRILGVYMVNEDFIGRLCEDGYVPAHSQYKIQLTEEESEKILFWNYYINEKNPDNITWNTGKYRYFKNLWMAQILRDIAYIKNGSDEEELAQEFFKHFCDMNKITDQELAQPNGALMNVNDVS